MPCEDASALLFPRSLELNLVDIGLDGDLLLIPESYKISAEYFAIAFIDYDKKELRRVNRIFRVQSSGSLNECLCDISNGFFGFSGGIRINIQPIEPVFLSQVFLSAEVPDNQPLTQFRPEFIQYCKSNKVVINSSYFLDNANSVFVDYCEPFTRGVINGDTKIYIRPGLNYKALDRRLQYTQIQALIQNSNDNSPINLTSFLINDAFVEDNFAYIHPLVAQKLKVKEGDFLSLNLEHKKIILPLLLCVANFKDLLSIGLSAATIENIFGHSISKAVPVSPFLEYSQLQTACVITISKQITPFSSYPEIQNDVICCLEQFFSIPILFPTLKATFHIKVPRNAFYESTPEFLENEAVVKFQILSVEFSDNQKSENDIGSFMFVPGTTLVIQEKSHYLGLSNNTILEDRTESNRLHLLISQSLKSEDLMMIFVTGRYLEYNDQSIKKIAKILNVNYFPVDCVDLALENSLAFGLRWEAILKRAIFCSPVIIGLLGIDALFIKARGEYSNQDEYRIQVVRHYLDRLGALFNTTKEKFMIFATAAEEDSVPERVRHFFVVRHTVTAADRSQMSDIKDQLNLLPEENDLGHSLSELTPDQRVQVDRLAILFATKRARNFVRKNKDQDCSHLQKVDYKRAVELFKSKSMVKDQEPLIPVTKWQDIGGLEFAKKEILQTIDMPINNVHLFTNNMKKRSGMLFYGPPGTGKTLLAKAIANNFSMKFFSIKGPELLDMYIGESEANVRNLFARAREDSPSIIFFDEIDSLAPKRGAHGDSGGVMDRIVSQILAEMDDISSNNEQKIFVIGATNRPDLLDPSILRPGRFDRLLYIPPPSEKRAKLKILEAQTKHFNLHKDVDLDHICEICDPNLSGADLYALASDAILTAIMRMVRFRLTNSQGKRSIRAQTDKSESQIVVRQTDLIQAAHTVKASVSAENMEQFKRLQSEFQHMSILDHKGKQKE